MINMEAESGNGSTGGREERSFESGKRISRWSVVAARRSDRLLIESKFKGGGCNPFDRSAYKISIKQGKGKKSGCEAKDIFSPQ